MKAHIKTSFILSFLLSFLLICLPHVNAQDFLKKLLSSSLIKDGKQLKSVGDYPSAITKFTKSIKKEPENLEAYYQLGLIFEEVMHDYDKAISLYKNVIILSEGVKPAGTDDEIKIFNSLIANTKKSIDRSIGKKFESIEKPKVHVYIMVKPDQKILKEPKMFSFSKYKTTGYASKFKLLDFSDNWYQVNVPSIGQGWVNGKDVLKIIQKEKHAIETGPAGKAALYQRFADLYPDSRFTQNAKDKADDIYYGLANEEGSINSYSNYLKKYPDGKHAKAARLKLDTLTFHDESFFNNINRLRHWITNNPESTFIEKAKKRIDELTFAQAKHDNNIKALGLYITEYPQGKSVSEARQIIEYKKYNQAKFKDSIDSYRKYLDEYPDGKYADDAAKSIDEKEFSNLLNSKNIELLAEHLKNETKEERVELVKNRIEELYFKKADGADNDAEAIKMYELYLEKYADGLYVQESKTGIEELFFDIATKTNTKDAYNGFIEKYPQSKHYQDAIDSIEVLDFNVALREDTIESFKGFLMTYPDGEFAQMAGNRIEEIAFKEAKGVDTIEAHGDFIKKYPNSKLSKEAKTRISQITDSSFGNAREKDTIESYTNFLEEYPDSKFSLQAKKRTEELTFEDAKTKDTISAYKEFIKEYPDSRLAIPAKNIIETKHFENARLKGTVKAYKEYVELYPDGHHLGEARLMIDKLIFEPYREKGSIRGFKKFIKKYPDNRYVEEAGAGIEQLNFEYYRKKNTLKAYKKFVTKYPDNRNVDEAKQKIILLQTSNIGEESDSGFPYLLTIIIFSGVGIAIAGVLMRKRVVSIVQSWQQGDWSCKCGTKHNKDIENCSVCGNTRPKFNKASLIGYTIWLREKLYALYGKLSEKEREEKKMNNRVEETMNDVTHAEATQPTSPPARIAGSTAVDLALAPERLYLAMTIAVVWIVPTFLLMLLGVKASLIIPAAAFFAVGCINCLAGGIARMTAIELDEARNPKAREGLQFIKNRWASLVFGPIIVAIAFGLTLAIAFVLIAVISKLAFIGALLTIPVFLFVLIGFSIALNIYLLCAIVGYDDVGMMTAVKRLIAISKKNPFQLLNGYLDAVLSLAPIATLSGIIVLIGIFITNLLTTGPLGLLLGLLLTGGDYASFFSHSSLKGSLDLGSLTGSIRLASIGIIIFAWIAFMANVIAVAYALIYRDSSN